MSPDTAQHPPGRNRWHNQTLKHQRADWNRNPQTRPLPLKKARAGVDRADLSVTEQQPGQPVLLGQLREQVCVAVADSGYGIVVRFRWDHALARNAA